MVKYATLSWKGLATAFAIMWGLYLAVASWLAGAGTTTIWFSPEMFGILSSMYPGLVPGAIFIGLLWGLACGAVCGGILAWLYNWATGLYK